MPGPLKARQLQSFATCESLRWCWHHNDIPTSFLPSFANAHIATFAKGMYCQNGLPGENNFNTNLAVNPLYQLSKKDWWFQHDRGCDKAPPPPGEFLDIPAGGQFTVEHANNQDFTTLSYDGSEVSNWPDGARHPANWHGEWDGAECLPGGGWMHTTNHSNAQGTAFAIAYESDVGKIKMEDLTVLSVLKHTPWNRLATYQVPDGCGQQNMYMQEFKCKATNAGTRKIARAKPPVWCADDQSKCRQGAKQMIVFNQVQGNNIKCPEFETPAYNHVAGFRAGAQTDIFVKTSLVRNGRCQLMKIRSLGDLDI